MTEKRFTCHQIIADYSTGEDIDFDFLHELIDEQKQPKDLRMHISDGNKIITYRECVDLLNDLSEENKQLEKRLQIYKSDGLETLEKLQRCYNNSKKAMKTIDALDEENEQLKSENKILKENLEHCANQFTDDGKNVLLGLR